MTSIVINVTECDNPVNLSFPWNKPVNQAATGEFVKDSGAVLNSINDRLFIGSDFDGGFNTITGLTPLAYALHAWGARDSQLFVDSTVGAMAITGHTQTSRVSAAWPGYPTYKQSGIGVSGFAINDMEGGTGWAGYMDSVRMPNAGFTPTMEICNANFGNTHNITPFNHLTGVSNAVTMWMATGNGLDLADHTLADDFGLSWKDINHSDAVWVSCTSISQGKDSAPWSVSTPYAVDSYAKDPQTQIVYRSTASHTSPASGDMVSERGTNPTRWKALPGARKGFVFTAGSLAELAPGSNVFQVLNMHERVQISWDKGNALSSEQSAYIWCDNIPVGAPTVGLTWTQSGARFDKSDVIIDADKGVRIGGQRIIGAQQPTIPSPNAEVASLKYVVDQMRQLLVNHGLMAPS